MNAFVQGETCGRLRTYGLNKMKRFRKRMRILRFRAARIARCVLLGWKDFVPDQGELHIQPFDHSSTSARAPGTAKDPPPASFPEPTVFGIAQDCTSAFASLHGKAFWIETHGNDSPLRLVPSDYHAALILNHGRLPSLLVDTSVALSTASPF